MRASAADWQTSLRLRRVSALLWSRVLDAKLRDLDRAIKAFDPNQPRVPAGNPDGGQWTDASGAEQHQVEAMKIAAPATNRAMSYSPPPRLEATTSSQEFLRTDRQHPVHARVSTKSLRAGLLEVW
ncbi:MAG TPA: hypothetical protein VMW68_04665 [Methyloceanibacter sp.]|nr:hypothetical protein [Methyloceanibacter sp.]